MQGSTQNTPRLSGLLTNLTSKFQSQASKNKNRPKISSGGGVLVLIVALFVMPYTMWRGMDFINATIPPGLPFREIIIICGLGGLDIGAVVWGLCWMRYTIKGTKQDILALVMWIIDMAAVVVAGLADSIINSPDLHVEVESLRLVSLIGVMLIILANAAGFWAYHAWSPKTEAERDDRERNLELEKLRAIAHRDHEFATAKADIEAETIRLNYDLEMKIMQADLGASEQFLTTREQVLTRMEQAAAIKRKQDEQNARLATQLNIMRPRQDDGAQPEPQRGHQCIFGDCTRTDTELMDGNWYCQKHIKQILDARERTPDVPPPPMVEPRPAPKTEEPSASRPASLRDALGDLARVTREADTEPCSICGKPMTDGKDITADGHNGLCHLTCWQAQARIGADQVRPNGNGNSPKA